MEDLERTVNNVAARTQRWKKVVVVPQQAENADTKDQALVKFQKIYALFGASGESAQDEVFAALVGYLLVNGCSHAGRYSKEIRTAGGLVAGAGDVVAITGRLEGEIRQFMRGRLEDSYLLLKHNSSFKEDPVLRARAQNAGIPLDQLWLMADWLGRDCPYFVGDEAEIYNRYRTSKIAAAQVKRQQDLPVSDRVSEMLPEVKVPRLNGVSHDTQGLY